MARRTDSPLSHQYLRVPTTAEADHRIANSLAIIAGLVRLRASEGVGDTDPAAFLREIAARIDAVARLHQHLARSRGETVQLDAYLKEICANLCAALAPSETAYEVVGSRDVMVPFRIALPLGLMTAELFSNSLKYAHPSGLPVKMSFTCAAAGPDALHFAAEDDGVGFPEGFDPSSDEHLGMRFIRLMSEQLGGMPRWTSDSLGVRFEVRIKLGHAADEPGSAEPNRQLPSEPAERTRSMNPSAAEHS